MQSASDGFEATVRPVGDVYFSMASTYRHDFGDANSVTSDFWSSTILKESHLKFLDPVGSLDFRL